MYRTILSIAIAISLLSLFSIQKGETGYLYQTKQYRIRFPQKPSEESQTLQTEVGPLLMKIHMYDASSSPKEDNLIYGCIETEYPDSLIQASKDESYISGLFRGGIDGTVNNAQGKLLSESIISIQGYPGREIKADFKDGLAIIRMRFYMVKNRMYILQTITLTGKDPNPSTNQFFNSFRLL